MTSSARGHEGELALAGLLFAVILLQFLPLEPAVVVYLSADRRVDVIVGRHYYSFYYSPFAAGEAHRP